MKEKALPLISQINADLNVSGDYFHIDKKGPLETAGQIPSTKYCLLTSPAA